MSEMYSIKPKKSWKSKMNFRKFRKNAKALSPVTATIILIAFNTAIIVAARALWEA
jgi:hypothetical protein